MKCPHKYFIACAYAHWYTVFSELQPLIIIQYIKKNPKYRLFNLFLFMLISRNSPFLCYIFLMTLWCKFRPRQLMTATDCRNNRLGIKFSEDGPEACTFHKWEPALQRAICTLFWIIYVCLFKKPNQNTNKNPTCFPFCFFPTGWSNTRKHLWWDRELRHYSQRHYQSLPRAWAESTAGGQAGRWVLVVSDKKWPSGVQ